MIGISIIGYIAMMLYNLTYHAILWLKLKLGRFVSPVD